MSDEPPTHQEISVGQDYIQPNLNYALRIWWAYYWPTSLISGVLIVLANSAIRHAYADSLISANVAVWALRIQPYFLTYATAIPVFYYLLGKTFRHFRLALLSLDGDSPVARTFGRTVRVWWTFSWRVVVYTLIISFASGVTLGFVMGLLSTLGRTIAALMPIAQSILIGGAAGLFVVYSNILDEEFGDFRVVLLPHVKQQVAQPTSEAYPA